MLRRIKGNQKQVQLQRNQVNTQGDRLVHVFIIVFQGYEIQEKMETTEKVSKEVVPQYHEHHQQ